MNCHLCGTLKNELVCSVPVYLVYSNNIHYLRMRALHQLSTASYRHDVISGNVAEYIMAGMLREKI